MAAGMIIGGGYGIAIPNVQCTWNNINQRMRVSDANGQLLFNFATVMEWQNQSVMDTEVYQTRVKFHGVRNVTNRYQVEQQPIVKFLTASRQNYDAFGHAKCGQPSLI